MFIILSGISASGKNTVIQQLMKRRNNIKVLLKSSCTTRAPRESDSEFQTYNYLSVAEFENYIKEGQFIEHEKVHGEYYGTLKSAFDIVIDDKENDYIRDIDVKGSLNIKKYLNGKVKVLSIFLDAPDEELRRRLKGRGESEERIEVRLSRGGLEREYKKYYDLVIDNIDLNKTLEIIENFIDKAREEK